MNKDIRLIALWSLILVTTATTTFAAPEMVLKFAGQNAPGHPVTRQMEAIAEEINRKTDGRIALKIYPANQLGDYNLVYEELIRGTIDLSCTSLSTRFDARMAIIHLSGFVSTYEDLKRTFATDSWLSLTTQKLSNALGVKHLGFLVEGISGTGTTKPLIEPCNPKAERSGFFHIPRTQVYRHSKKTMGYPPLTILDAEMYRAIQTGIIDGISGYSVATAYSVLGDVLKYWYMNNASFNILSLMSSKKSKSDSQHLKKERKFFT